MLENTQDYSRIRCFRMVVLGHTMHSDVSRQRPLLARYCSRKARSPDRDGCVMRKAQHSEPRPHRPITHSVPHHLRPRRHHHIWLPASSGSAQGSAAQPCAVLKKLKHRKRDSNFREFEALVRHTGKMLYIDDKRAPTTPLQFVKNLKPKI